jgi:hypothetical protein
MTAVKPMGPSREEPDDNTCVLCGKPMVASADGEPLRCGCSQEPSLTDVFKALHGFSSRLRFVLTMEYTKDDDAYDSGDAGRPVYTAYIFLQPPEGGWQSDGEMYQHPKGSPSYDRPVLDQYRFRSSCLVGTNAYDPETAARLALHMFRDARERYGHLALAE